MAKSKNKDGRTSHSRALKYCDDWFSRKRRSEWSIDTSGLSSGGFTCVTCRQFTLIKNGDCGHCIPRGEMRARFLVMNTAGQCGKCNRYNNGETIKFLYSIENRYGLDVREKLEEIGRGARGKTYTTPELLEMAEKFQNETLKIWEKEGLPCPWKKERIPKI